MNNTKQINIGEFSINLGATCPVKNTPMAWVYHNSGEGGGFCEVKVKKILEEIKDLNHTEAAEKFKEWYMEEF